MKKRSNTVLRLLSDHLSRGASQAAAAGRVARQYVGQLIRTSGALARMIDSAAAWCRLDTFGCAAVILICRVARSLEGPMHVFAGVTALFDLTTFACLAVILVGIGITVRQLSPMGPQASPDAPKLAKVSPRDWLVSRPSAFGTSF